MPQTVWAVLRRAAPWATTLSVRLPCFPACRNGLCSSLSDLCSGTGQGQAPGPGVLLLLSLAPCFQYRNHQPLCGEGPALKSAELFHGQIQNPTAQMLPLQSSSSIQFHSLLFWRLAANLETITKSLQPHVPTHFHTHSAGTTSTKVLPKLPK